MATVFSFATSGGTTPESNGSAPMIFCVAQAPASAAITRSAVWVQRSSTPRSSIGRRNGRAAAAIKGTANQSAETPRIVRTALVESMPPCTATPTA